MKRFVLIWSALALTLLVATKGASLVLFHHLDLRFAAHFQQIFIPLFQALVLYWVTRPTSSRRQPFSSRLPAWLPVLLLIEAGALVIGWQNPEHSRFGLLGNHSLQPAWIGLQAALAGTALLAALSVSGWNRRERIWLAGLALLLLLSAAEMILPWAPGLMDYLFTSRSSVRPEAIARAGLFLLLFALLVQSTELLRRRCRGAAILASTAVLLLLLVLNLFLLALYQPQVPAGIKLILRSGASLGATLVLASSLVCLAVCRGRGTASVSRQEGSAPISSAE